MTSQQMPKPNQTPRRKRPDPRELALEIVRRACAGNSSGFTGMPYVVRLSDPPTSFERLQLLAARLLQTPIAIMPHPCRTADEWMQHYGKL